MQLSNHDLSQLDEDDLLNLTEKELRYLSIKLLNDLKDARDCLSQSSRNSSRPPSSDLPWDKSTEHQKSNEEQIKPKQDNEPEKLDKNTEDKEEAVSPKPPQKDSVPPLRQQGKQLGALGFGRTQKIAVTNFQQHYPSSCACCGTSLTQPLWTKSP